MPIRLSTHRLEPDGTQIRLTKPSPKSTPIVIKDTSDANNSQLVPKRPPKVTKEAPQEQHIVPVTTETMQTIVTNKLVNPDLKTLLMWNVIKNYRSMSEILT